MYNAELCYDICRNCKAFHDTMWSSAHYFVVGSGKDVCASLARLAITADIHVLDSAHYISVGPTCTSWRSDHGLKCWLPDLIFLYLQWTLPKSKTIQHVKRSNFIHIVPIGRKVCAFSEHILQDFDILFESFASCLLNHCFLKVVYAWND